VIAILPLHPHHHLHLLQGLVLQKLQQQQQQQERNLQEKKKKGKIKITNSTKEFYLVLDFSSLLQVYPTSFHLISRYKNKT
jgi:hypothetical protein